jgi:hypothetical protein
MKSWIVFAGVLSIASTCACAARPGSTPAADRAHAAREVPFEIASNKPWVQVRVNGSAPQWFILDTGCRGTSVIARACAQRLHLRLGDETEASVGAGQGVKVGFTTTPDVVLDVAGDAFEAPSLGVFPFDHVEPYEGRAIDGLLGQDFMRRHVVEIDYARRVLRLHDPESYVASGSSTPIPITFHDGLAVAEARMTPPGRAPIPCQVVIDTGVRTSVVWYHPFVLAHDLVASQSRVITGTIGGGAGGETTGDIGRLASLEIGALTIPRPPVVFSRDTSGVFAESSEDGIVGGELLRRCKVTFDYPHQRLYLEPYRGEFSELEYDMSGMFLIAAGPDFRHVTVQSVADGTPAAEAGLAKGDEIVAIDGHSTAGRTLDDVREQFKTAGATRRLDVKHGAEQRAVQLALRPLV